MTFIFGNFLSFNIDRLAFLNIIFRKLNNFLFNKWIDSIAFYFIEK